MNPKRRYFKQVRIAQCRAVLEIARRGGFSAAAEALDLSTPSVWQQARALEQEFGVPLIEVRQQEVVLTEHGRLFIELAEPVVQGFDLLLEHFNEETRAIPRKLSVASPGNILVNELPSPIREYFDLHPDVDLNVIDVASNVARRLLEDGEVDLAVAGQLDTTLPKTLCADPITSFPFLLVCPEGHPVLRCKRISIKTLAKYPLVMSGQGTNTRRRVDEVFAAAGVLDGLRAVCETSTKDLAMRFVQLGFGIFIAPISPRYANRLEWGEGGMVRLCFRDVSNLFGSERIVIFRRRYRHEPEHQRAFREIILRVKD